MGRVVFCVGLFTALAFGAPMLPAGEIHPSRLRHCSAARPADRPAQTDLLLLHNGDKLAGTVLSESFSLRTAYARLQLERRHLASVTLADGAERLDSITTVNSNRISGFLEDASFAFQPATGARIDLRREKVARVIFGARDAERQELPRGRWVGLKNGDRLSGQFLADSLPLLAPVGGQKPAERVSVRLADAAALVFTTNHPALAAVSLRNGQVLRGALAVEDLRLKLDLGPQIDLYADTIEWIADSPDGPAGVIATAFDSVGAQPSTNGFQTSMVWIAPGEFVMGSPTEEPGRDADEGPQTRVIIPNGFWMGKCEVTQAEYQQVVGSNPSNVTDDPARPVERVNWYEAMEYCGKLTRQAQAAGRLPEGHAYRLPTEAEWEYACRAGTTTRFSWGDDRTETLVGDYAWFVRNSEATTHPVGGKKPNPWGLYDMHGNVWEWCLDRWEGSLPGGTITNLPARTEGALRVARGGSWLYEGRACRSANRDDYSPSNRCSDLGFRVVLAPIQP